MEENQEPNSLKILLTSGILLDNFSDNKELRKDPFENLGSFFEIFKEQNCDFSLIAGNLFNSSNPSNSSIAATLNCFRRMVVGEKEHEIEVDITGSGNLSNFGPKVKIPVFAMHGDKDGPSLESPVSPLEILAQSSYLNYVGKTKNLELIKIRPILFKKEQTKAAFYFLSHVKEASLSRLLIQDKVLFVEPEKPGYMKILVIHQKRSSLIEKSQSYPTLDIHHDHLPKVFDLVIWTGDSRVKESGLDKNVDENLKILKLNSCSVSKIRSSYLTQRSFVLLSLNQGQISIQKIPLPNTRPSIVMKVNPSFIEIESGYREVLKNEAAVEKEVMQRLGVYYQKGGTTELAKPILKVKIDFPGRRSLNFNALEEKFKGLVANYG